MMNKETHTRNQKRMYRIHKLEEKIHNQDLLIGTLQQRIDRAIEYINKYKRIYDVDGSEENMLDEFNILASPKKLIEILGGKE